MMSFNPLMTIALSAELCDKISKSRAKFENKAGDLKTDLLDLGETFISKIESS